jgi:hypothetical protein
MIVRDEEAYLPGFIAHHRELFDDWVIVDTGSSDRSRRIIQEAGIPCHRFTWCEDFAKARNAALSQCKGSWVLALDADERLATSSWPQIRKLIADPTLDAVELAINNYVNEDEWSSLSSPYLLEYNPPDGSYQDIAPDEEDVGYRRTELLRLFRRASGLQWKSPIHETLYAPSGHVVHEIARHDILIHHLGWLHTKHARKEQKSAQYKRIAQESFETAQKSRDPKLLFEAARMLDCAKDKRKALELAAALAPKEPAIFKALSNTYLELELPALALRSCESLIELEDSLAAHIAKAACLERLGRQPEALNALRSQLPRFRNEALFHHSLAQLALQEHDLRSALSYAKRAVRLAPQSESFRSFLQKLKTLCP